MVRRCAYDGDGGAPEVRVFAASTACGQETALPARTISTIFFQPSAFMGNRTDFCIDLFAFTIHSPAWETAPISASICSPSIRSPAWNRTDFCTSDYHLGLTHGRKSVSPSRNPCDSDPFWSQLTIDVRLHENQFLYARSRMKRHLSLFFYLPPSVGLLLTIWTRFSVRVYDRAWGASFALFYLPPSVGLLPTIWTRLSVHVYDRAWEAYFALFLSTAERRLTRAIFGTQSRSSYELK